MRFALALLLLPGLGLGSPMLNIAAPLPQDKPRHDWTRDAANSTDVDLVDTYELKGKKMNWRIVKAGYDHGGDFITKASGAVVIVAAVIVWINRDSIRNWGGFPTGATMYDDDGNTLFNVEFHATTKGDNYRTTAQTKTVATALDDAITTIHNKGKNWACVEMDHDGTWQGHFRIATETSQKDVRTMCDDD